MTVIVTSRVDRVAVEDPDEPLSYHDPEQLATTTDMTILSRAEARNRGAVGCSHCFEDVNCTSYLIQTSQQ